ncbi:ABC transporter permease YtrF [Ferriphaselus amnicola]|uniref:ABC transporter permease YtrF n=1 Tax=Ferriphaselus amnicola TaxID=1188319 RepID=A0A2Z6GE32_9PROT|nr:FtsX-like permease family protein [Ferriphaselus amnicola]BBE51727.1 ABC transporter permease YtrF [Ferriphaselus amnicola]
MNTFKLALRGLSRNRRRSLVTLLAIAFGFAAISLFAGYTHNVYDGLARQSIHGELLGHLTISRRGMSTEGKLDPEHYLLSSADVARITQLLKDEPHIKLIAPRLGLSGLVSNGRASTIFIAEGISPQAMEKLQENVLTADEVRSGMYASVIKKLDPAASEKVLLSEGLAEMLHLKPGDTAPLLTNTIGGQANALDATVGGLFNTGNAGSNDKFAFMPLALAQSLYDVDSGADRLTVLLDDVARTESMRDDLLGKLKMAGFDVEIKTWQELSDFYNQVHDMFDMIFGFIFSIVLTVVVMSVANSMGMTVVERTREIGTLRAIGLKRGGVVRLFTAEALLLTLLGCAVGVAITFAVRYGINVAHISYTPPNSASAVPLLVDVDAGRTLFTAMMMLLVGSLAAYLPARRAARQPVIDALGHV